MREAFHKDRHIPGQSMGVLLLQDMCFSCFNMTDMSSKIPKYCSISFSSTFIDFPVHCTEYKLV